ncbi:MAG: hydrogenase nickel incorporation protein HypB [Clostridiales bacterium]|nr:hydrogenase nickel incorporation protein HypB [Clostridiales bacterium]
MHDVKKVNVMEGILDENDHIAFHVNEKLSKDKILCVNVMGAPGAGKTTTLKNLIRRLDGLGACVIEGDIESDIDTQELKSLGIKAYQINTFGACHLDAPMVQSMVDSIDLGSGGILFIENIGNLVCPAEFSIGEHVKMLVASVTEGSDKPYKYPLAFEKADMIVLNKTDLLPYVDFDEEFFMKGVRALNKDAMVFKTSGRSEEGFVEAAAWLSWKASQVGNGSHHHD